MNRKALETIEQYHMIRQGDELAVGVSGGADSVALLHFLCDLGREYGLSVTALHLNHNLRGEESDRDEAFVRKLCRELGVPLETASLDIAALAGEVGLSIEECARRERYAFFEKAVTNGKIATAHTLSDSVETLLLNLARGSGLRGLCGIPPVRGRIIRPLIRCTRDEIEDYCRREGLSYVTDSTNLEDRYTRNRIRHHIVPALAEVNPAFLDKAGEALELLRQDADYLDSRAAEELAKLQTAPGYYSRGGFLALPEALRGRALRLLLNGEGVEYSLDRIRLLEKGIAAGTGALQLGRNLYAVFSEEHFTLEKREEADAPPFQVKISLQSLEKTRDIPLLSGKSVQLIRMDCEEFEKTYESKEKLLKNCLDCDKIGEIASFRQRLPGDSIRLAGRGCTKSLKKLCNENKLTQRQRGRMAVLAAEDGTLLWVEGFGVSESVRVTETTKQVLAISVMEEMYAGGYQGSTHPGRGAGREG